MLSDDQKIQIMEDALRQGYDGYMTDLWAQSDPEEAMAQQQESVEPVTNDAPDISPGLPPGRPTPGVPAPPIQGAPEPGFQSLVQSYEAAAPGQQPKGETVQNTLADPAFYRAGGYKLRDSIDLKLDFKSIDPNTYIDNYTKSYKYKELGGMADTDKFDENTYDPINFAEYYYKSDKHKQRMENSGYTPAEIDKRSEFLDTDFEIDVNNNTDDRSYADPTNQRIHIDVKGDEEKGYRSDEVLPHEVAHLSTGLKGLNKTDVKQISDRHKIVKDGGKFTTEEEEYRWALEAKADLDSIRYLLFQADIYDAGLEDFDFYDLTKAKELLGDSEILRRVLENYDENDFMWLMNNVAIGDPTEEMFDDTTYARKGGFSKEGYKENSPHRNRPFNIIKGEKGGTRITMKGVKGPLLAFDNLGNKGILKPEGEYKFAGSSVIETPLRKKKRKTGGLWANIHAKRKRIASGSGEKMRKPGSKGAPTNRALKRSQN
tara:strand:+ start:4203 stop:5663 length:1461 start_codon:yes stop_codon:yes gene_type:complete